jgi:signal transduction histidine kinase
MQHLLDRGRDGWLPAVILLLGVVELSSTRPDGWGRGIAVEAVACLLLVWRRRWPVVLATLAAVVLLTMPWLGPQLNDAAVPIAVLALSCYSLGRYVRDLRGLVGLAVIALVLLLDYLLVDTRDYNVGDIFYVGALMTPPYVLGRIIRRLADQTARLAAQQAVIRREAVRAERARVARELHDVLAHSVSAMVVQASAAEDLVRSDPDRAGRALRQVADTGRRTLAETGAMLHLLRDEEDELGLAPTAGLAALPELVEDFRRHGLDVELQTDGALAPLPLAVDLSAYRIVQEALTNALRHAGDQHARLRVRRTAAELAIEAVNACRRDASGVRGSGLGLVGMAERVGVLGGRISHGAVQGVFRLDVSLPLATEPTPAEPTRTPTVAPTVAT